MALTGGAYVSTYAVTDTVNAGTNYTVAANQNLAIDNRGYQRGALFTVLGDLITKWNLCMTAVEADGATTTTYTPANALTTLASRGMEKNGMHQSDVIACLTEVEDNLATILDLLDADGGVTLTTYNAVALAAGNPGGVQLALGATVDGSKGISHADIVAFMENAIDKWNATLANMDVDDV